MGMGRFIAAFGFASSFFAASVASAAVVVVSPTGPLTSIQAGVDAAAPGDTVLVKAGVYEGVVAIPAGKAGLVIKGKGAVVLDARAANGDPLGDAIEVGANAVTIQGITIRHAAELGADAGHAIVGLGNELHVLKCRMLRCTGAAVRMDEEGLLDVRNCFFDTLTSGVVAGAIRGGVRDTTFRTIFSDAIDVEAVADFAIERCTFRGVRQSAARLSAGPNVGLTMRECRVDQVFDSVAELISVGGASFVFEGNKCSNFVRGIFRSGAGALEVKIRKNDFKQADGFGGDGSGFCVFLFGNVSGEIANNRASFCIGGFVQLSEFAQNVTLHDDRVTDVLTLSKGRAFFVDGTGITLVNERALRCTTGAFTILSDGATLESCVAQSSSEDGFQIKADNVTLIDCVATDCAGEGFQNEGVGTKLVDCVAKKNRIDIATTQPFAELDATFQSGGSNQLPEID